MLNIFATIIEVLIVVIIVGMIGAYFIIRRNSQEPEMERQWTDPKFHDRV